MNKTQHRIDSAGLFKEYIFSVRSMNSLGAGPEPKEVRMRSGRNPPTGYPTNVYIARISRFTVSMRWNPVEDADGYRYACYCQFINPLNRQNSKITTTTDNSKIDYSLTNT